MSRRAVERSCGASNVSLGCPRRGWRRGYRPREGAGVVVGLASGARESGEAGYLSAYAASNFLKLSVTVRNPARSDNCGHFLGIDLLSPRRRNTLFIPILSRGRGREEPTLTCLVPVAVARHSLPFAVGCRRPRNLLRLAFPATKHFAAAAAAFTAAAFFADD